MRKMILFSLALVTVISLTYSCQNAKDLEFTSYYSNGKDIYQAYCKNCHGENGEGLGLLAPPLTDTLFLKKEKQKLACIIKYGSKVPMIINGKVYDEKMPAFPKLADIDLAQVMVYVTNSFGNKQGNYGYDQVRKDLMRCQN